MIDPDFEWLMIDATHVKGQGRKGTTKIGALQKGA
jgi:hypothetical protein